MESATTGGTIKHGQIAALTPGRVRLRLHRPHRHLAATLKKHLEAQRGISKVAANQTTGSVLVHYEHRTVSCDDVLAMCRDIGVVVSSIAEVEEEPVDVLKTGHVSEGISGAFRDLDRRLPQISRTGINLRWVGPLVLGGLGVRQFMVGGLGNPSGYILLVLAVNSSIRARNRGRQRRPRATVTVAESGAS